MALSEEVEGTVIDMVEHYIHQHSSEYHIILQTINGIIHVKYHLDLSEEFHPLRDHIQHKKVKITIVGMYGNEIDFSRNNLFESRGLIQLLDQ